MKKREKNEASEIKTIDLNQNLKEVIQNQELDFGCILASSLEGKLSVTAEYYNPSDKSEYVKLDDQLNPTALTTDDEFYYGVSPLFDNDEIIDVISNLRISSGKGIEEYIRNHRNWFMIHADQKKFLLDMAKMIIVSVTCAFSLELRLTPDEYNILKNICDDFDNAKIATWKLEIDIITDDEIKKFGELTKAQEEKKRKKIHDKFNKNNTHGILTLHGCPTDRMLEALSKFKYSKNSQSQYDSLSNRVYWGISNDGIEIRQIYNEHSNDIVLTNGKVFYSGSMIRPRKITPPTISYEDDKVRSIVVHFEKTTYATILSFDSNYTEHPLLKDTSIVYHLNRDDSLKMTMINKLEQNSYDTEEMFNCVNDYLESGYNPTHICVSGNIVTRDDRLLFSHRGDGNIDSGKIYPGVNGSAEIADPNVSFYRHSMYEDVPRIKQSDYRIDFSGEISREAYEEISVDMREQNWNCCGIIISGNKTKHPASGCYNEIFRRLHFNIIFEQETDKSFFEIDKLSKKANEQFENDSFIAIRLICRRNWFSMLFKELMRLFEFVCCKKDFFESVLALLLCFYSIKHFFKNEVLWYKATTLVVAVIVVIYTMIQVLQGLKIIVFNNKRSKRLCLYRNTKFEDKNKIIKRKFGKYKYHPVTYATYILYIYIRIKGYSITRKEM